MDELLEILNEVKPGVDFENDTDLIGHGVLDSITMVTLVMELNDAFDIEITPVDIVRENTAQTVRRQRFQPPEPVNLILAQNTVKLFRNADFIGVIQHFTVGTYLSAELRASFNSDILRGTPKTVEIQHSERRNPDFFFHKGLI